MVGSILKVPANASYWIDLAYHFEEVLDAHWSAIQYRQHIATLVPLSAGSRLLKSITNYKPIINVELFTEK